MFASPSAVDKNCILTGYLGPAQLIVARRTAERLRLGFVDFQTELERRAGVDEEELRLRFGEARLKTLENEIIGDLALYRGTLIHVSGGALCRGGHLEMLSATGTVICLVAALDTVLQRLHLALGARYHDPRARAQALGVIRREWAVRARVDPRDVIDTSALDEAQIVERIAAHWRERAAVLDWRAV
jgi:shikimate kinase